VPIGETLVQARHQAGLTVAQVSERTCIRETIIRGIEEDDYSACGGDFYARGHIRAIAKVVGAYSGPLIREYDMGRRAPGALAAASLEELLAAGAQTPQRRRPDVPGVCARVASVCAPAWRRVSLPAVRELAARAYRSFGRRLSWTTAGERAASDYAPPRHRLKPPALWGPVASACASARRTVNWTAVLGLALVMVLGVGVYRLLPGSPHAPVAPSAGQKHTVDRRNARHNGPNPAPKTSHAAAPSPAPARPAQPLTPVHAAAFGPGGGDNPQLAHLAIGGHRTAGWHTDWYTTARFGNLYPGTGLLLNMGRTVAITSVRINLGRVSGSDFQLRVGTKPALADMPPVAHAASAGGMVRLRLTRPAHGRYVLVWFTRLSADPAGTFQAHVLNIRLQGHS
jgi:hypothetical protein